MVRLDKFADMNEMQINCKKTKVMLFNTRKKFDFEPEIFSRDGDKFDHAEQFKLLGVHITRWNSHTKHICARAYSKMWMLKNLRRFGAKKMVLLKCKWGWTETSDNTHYKIQEVSTTILDRTSEHKF